MNQATINDSVLGAVMPFMGLSKTRKVCPGPWRILTRSAETGDRSEFQLQLVADGSTREFGCGNAIALQVARWQQVGDDFRMEQLASSGLLFVYSGTVVAPKYVQGAYYTPDDANLGGTFVAWRLDSIEQELTSQTMAMATV
jgi:hypothetical protein